MSATFMSAKLLDEVGTEVLLGCKSIVRLATEGKILHRVLAAPCEGFHVMELEPMRLSATLS